MHYYGEFESYVNPSFVSLIQIASVILVFMFFMQLQRMWGDNGEHECSENCSHQLQQGFTIGNLLIYGLLVLPILTGFFLPPGELDAKIADRRGIMLQAKGNDNIEKNKTISKFQQETIEKMLDEETIQMTDDKFILYRDQLFQAPQLFLGKNILLEGFVLKGDTLEENQFVVGRFLITHCVADATVVSFLVETEEKINVKENSWIKILGTISTTTHNGVVVLKIEAYEWIVTEKKQDRYLYPNH